MGPVFEELSTDLEIFTFKLQKMPGLNLCFEFSPQNPNLYVGLITYLHSKLCLYAIS